MWLVTALEICLDPAILWKSNMFRTQDFFFPPLHFVFMGIIEYKLDICKFEK